MVSRRQPVPGARHLPAVALVVLSFGGCASGAAGDSTTTVVRNSSSHRVATEEYLPGVEADLYLPEPGITPSSAVPVVVMVPGGAWVSADRSGLAPLAERLSSQGIAVVNATLRGANSTFRFPGPVQDVLCAVDFAGARMADRGLRAAPLILFGHSSGAHLAALAGLGASRDRDDCPYGDASVDGLALLSGIYDPATAADVAEPLFGLTPQEGPALWEAGSAFTWVGTRPGLPVFLAHGYADELVPALFTTEFADALQRAGHAVRVDLVAGAGHHDIYTPDVVAGPLEEWIASLE